MKLVILDRDGVINHDSPGYIKSPAEWLPITGSLEAIASLNQGGYHVVVATNQSGLGQGLFDMATLNAIHHKMHQALAQVGGRIDGIFYCPHTRDAQCQCRKPQPGLLQAIAKRCNTPLTDVPFIGDSERDILAGAAVGAQLHLVLTGNGLATQAAGLPPHTRVHADLAAGARELLRSSPQS